MAVPKKKTSKTRTNKRRSHHAISVNLATCAQCGQVKVPHIVCSTCGYYAGKPAKEVKSKV